MLNARRYECFCVDPTEQFMYAGNTSGQLSIIDIDAFEIVDEVQAHVGVVRAVTVHPTLPYLAALANDRCVTVWRREPDGSLIHMSTTSIRDVPCSNDDQYVEPIFSHTVALAFHHTERRIATRSGNGGVLELAFDDDGAVQALWCKRMHGQWDLQMTQYVLDSDMVLSAGRDGCLVLSEQGNELRRWQFGEAVAHWAEHVAGSTYLIASDEGRVLRVDIDNDDEPVVGERFARDDMEYVTYNKVSKRAFATSFDRDIHEIDPITCNQVGVAFRPGYKCIWAKSLERSPSTLLVQSRNGTLYKADADTGETLATISETPDALWSGVNLPGGDLLLAGEGSQLTRLNFASLDPISRAPLFERVAVETPMPDDTYTKRMVRQDATGRLVLARTDGDIWAGTVDRLERVTNLGAAVRDIAIAPTGDAVYAVTEDGRAVAIDLSTGTIENEFRAEGRPFSRSIWTLAHNPVRNLLAFAEFGGDMHIVSTDDFSEVDRFECARPKRMRWADADTLLHGHSDEVHRYSLRTRKSAPLVTFMQNTVEDFIWDNARRYLLVICYQTTIALCDFVTGHTLDLVRDQLDYSKGLAWLDASVDPRLYPLDFVTYGRSGGAHHFRIHDEAIVALGPIGTR